MLNQRRLMLLMVVFVLPPALWLVGFRFEALALGMAELLVFWLLYNLRPARDTHGSARWATSTELRGADMFNPAGVVVGRLGYKLLRLGGDSHLLTVAPTRSGKGVGQIVPTLLTYQGSAFVLDVKGENYAVTAEQRRKMGQKVIVINPENLEQSGRLNPLDLVRRGSVKETAADIGILAELLAPRTGEGTSAHFNMAANSLIKALLWRTVSEKKEFQHLGTMREDLARLPDDLKALLGAIGEDVAKNAKDGGAAHVDEQGRVRLPAVAADAANMAASITGEEWSGVMSTARNATEIFAQPQVQELVGTSTFSFEDMKKAPTTVYLIVEPDQLDFYRQLLRVMVGLCVAAMVRNKTKPRLPVLFLLDEFPQLGHMAVIEKGISILAGYGVRFWVFVQDLSQIKGTYKDGWETLVGNCKIQAYFGITDLFTAEQLSRRLGNKTVQSRAASISGGAGAVVSLGNHENVNESETGRPLLTPDEILTLNQGLQIVTISGIRPILAEKVRYFADWRFKKKADKWLN